MKYIPGYEGRYALTEDGEFYSFLDSHGRFVPEPRKKYTSVNKKRFGYRYITLVNSEGKSKNWIAHRVVAMTFIPNTHNLPEINHKDGDKNNISVSNLEWCTSAQNKQHAIRILGHNYHRNKTGNLKKMFSKKVVQFTKKGVFVKKYNSATEASIFFHKK